MPYATPTREGDAIHTIRTIGRLAQILLDLRDEYERRPRPDTLDQIERRLGELVALREELRGRSGPPDPPAEPPVPATPSGVSAMSADAAASQADASGTLAAAPVPPPVPAVPERPTE